MSREGPSPRLAASNFEVPEIEAPTPEAKPKRKQPVSVTFPKATEQKQLERKKRKIQLIDTPPAEESKPKSKSYPLTSSNHSAKQKRKSHLDRAPEESELICMSSLHFFFFSTHFTVDTDRLISGLNEYTFELTAISLSKETNVSQANLITKLTSDLGKNNRSIMLTHSRKSVHQLILGAIYMLDLEIKITSWR